MTIPHIYQEQYYLDENDHDGFFREYVESFLLILCKYIFPENTLYQDQLLQYLYLEFYDLWKRDHREILIDGSSFFMSFFDSVYDEIEEFLMRMLKTTFVYSTVDVLASEKLSPRKAHIVTQIYGLHETNGDQLTLSQILLYYPDYSFSEIIYTYGDIFYFLYRDYLSYITI